MATYTVHDPVDAKADRAERAEDLVFVRDGFSWLAAIAPPLGLISHSLWLFAVLYLAAVVCGSIAWAYLGLDPAWLTLMIITLNVYIGFEVGSLKRWWLEQRGWQMIASVTGKNYVECERRFFESWLPEQPIMSLPSEKTATPSSLRGWFSLART